ncbi:MAG: ATP-binding protein [Lentimicrobium sp.]|uniref:ATP-binding protein n=1 Tax=Lentimicrobium sp. TaxID=2034841 RepID=UPI0025CD7E08|nr:ATP-binding protein [Lentimicrobium sp.]MCO5256362.1 ATP-binding protein [Lentimicrobium sp.]
MYERIDLQKLKKRIEEPRKFVQVVYGPRQVGKTTMVLQLTKQLPFQSMVVTADDVPAADRSWIRDSWNEARRRLSVSEGQEFLLVIDEIQKIDNWSESVKKEWDEDSTAMRNIKVIIMGSSRLLIQKGLTESLAGRFETTYLTHWSYKEMHDAFGWDGNQYIWFGGYPGAATLIENELRWKAYIRDSLIETSISKDILMLTRVDKPALLKRLFEIGCTYSAQIIALNKIQGELQEKGNLTTLSNYLSLLEGAGLLTGLEKFSGDIIRKRASRPKFQVFNNALLSAQSYKTYDEITKERNEWGRFVESAIGAHLLNASLNKQFNLYYWNENNQEVDFVMESGNRLIGIEVKTGKDSRNRGIGKFEAAFRPIATFRVGTDGIPVEEFLASDPYALFSI